MNTTNYYKIRLKKGDTVIVRAGKYKGKTGKITATHPRENKVTVEGINIVKKHVKPNQSQPTGRHRRDYQADLGQQSRHRRADQQESQPHRLSRSTTMARRPAYLRAVERRSSNGYCNQNQTKR